MSMDPTTPIMRPEAEWGDNEYSNYQRSYNNQTWNPVASVARSNAHSREYGVLLNPYVQVTPIRILHCVLNLVSMLIFVVQITLYHNSRSISSRNLLIAMYHVV